MQPVFPNPLQHWKHWFDGAPELARRVVDAVDVPVIAAGSIDGPERVQAMRQAGVWAFTIGSAIFDGRFGGEPVRRQVDTVLRMPAPCSST